MLSLFRIVVRLRMSSESNPETSCSGPVGKLGFALTARKPSPTPVATRPEAESRSVSPSMVLRSHTRGGRNLPLSEAHSTDRTENWADRSPATGLEPEIEMDTEVKSEPNGEAVLGSKVRRDVPASYSAVSQPMQGMTDFSLSTANEMDTKNPSKTRSSHIFICICSEPKIPDA